MATETFQKALFLDRDGIINVDHGYTYKIEDFEFSEGIFPLLEIFRNAGYLIFVITNQSGIGRGYYDESDFRTLTTWMTEAFAKKGITIEKVFHCPHAPDEMCHCRKPEIGMIEQALFEYPLDLQQSWMVGDKSSDITLAANAGISNAIYIGDNPLPQATYSFDSVSASARYFQENQGKIYHT